MSFLASLIVLSVVSFGTTNPQNAFPFYNQQQNFNNQRQRQPNQFGFYPQQFPFNNFGFQNFQTFPPQNQQNGFNRPTYQQPNNHNNNFQQPHNQNNYQQPTHHHQQPTHHHQQSTHPQTNRPQSQTTLKQPLITTVRPVQTTQQTFDRVSQRKCDEYAKLIKRRIQVASLSLDSTAQDITVSQCDAVTGLVVGGVEASPGEFPHMAAIGYPDFDGDLSFKCGGSLISDYFVLTAAHCSEADRTAPSVVRLGDHNLAVRDKNLPEIDIPVDSFISHESYNKETKENDIALIKLGQQVVFNKSIRPACLQQTENIAKSKAIATGWGYTEVGGSTSDVLQKVQLDIISNQQCSTLYNDDDNYRIFSSQICAGVLKGGKDTCGGDSGGPLQVAIGNECVFSIIGLTSYGSTYCGGKNSPGIYTRVSSYVDWIEGKVWP